MHTHLVSPHFTHKKLQPPFLRDVIDVFEDRVRYWLIEPARSLLNLPAGLVPAAAMATTYFESIEIYCSGQDSKNRSREFFCNGFRRIFQAERQPEEIQNAIANALYSALRCGFAHDGMPRSGINFSTSHPQTFLVTWPLKDGSFDPKGKLQSALVNPRAMIRGIDEHLTDYVRALRRGADKQQVQNFLAAVELKWELSRPGRLVAMTEEEYFSGKSRP